MKCTSAQAAKVLRQLKEEYRLITEKESNAKVFLAAVGEDPEELRPAYDYEATQKAIRLIEEKIRKIRHAINLFNVSQKVGDMTIDEVLVYLPQLQQRREKLLGMTGRRPKQRAEQYFGRYGKTSPVIDYEYANYDIDKVEEDYKEICEEIGNVQAALDIVNSTVEMEIDL